MNMTTLIRLIFTSILFLATTQSYSSNINPGDLLISELMSNPLQVSDTNGEWFEIFNTTANAIDLNGITISDDGSNLHEINNAGSLLIQAGDYFVLGRNGDSTLNGGYIADYVYSNFSLGNSSDQIILTKDNAEIARLNYSGSTFGTAGVSAELIFQSPSPLQTDYQLTENFFYGLGDIGSPGSAGSADLIHANPVPIPHTLWLFVTGLALLLRKAKQRNQLTRDEFNPTGKNLA